MLLVSCLLVQSTIHTPSSFVGTMRHPGRVKPGRWSFDSGSGSGAADGRRRKASAKSLWNGIMVLIIFMIAIQSLATIRVGIWDEHHGASVNVRKPMPHLPAPKINYTMWSKDKASMRHCELHYKNNETWGKLHAPYVDKIEAKEIVARMNVPSLRIPQTLAVLDETNLTGSYSLEFMRSLKQPYIIKSTHTSGGVARVYNDTYHCFKHCLNRGAIPLGPAAFKASKKNIMNDFKSDYSKNGGEMQYKYITHRVIFEEDLITGGKTDTDITFWWLANGHPVFATQQCQLPKEGKQGFEMSKEFVGTDYRHLPIDLFRRGRCNGIIPKPKTWDIQLEIMKRVGKFFPSEVVRVDVYAGGEEVWFSEFTFTTVGCWRRFTPAVVDGLLYELMVGRISPDAATPESVEWMLLDKSWVLVSLDDSRSSRAHPSPMDLCLTLEPSGRKQKRWFKDWVFERCISKLKGIQKFTLRCLVSEKNGTQLHSFGLNAENDKGRSNIELCASHFQHTENKFQGG